jgi:hypothetical protein
MSTLIAVYNSEGCVGRCDAKCYDATEPECDCICGGKNHGAGKQRATDNTRELAEQWIETYSKNHNLPGDAVWSIPAAQLSLPMF